MHGIKFEISPDLIGHNQEVNDVNFSNDGIFIISCEGKSFGNQGKNLIIMWNVEKSKEENIFIGHSNRITSVGFSPDGK